MARRFQSCTLVGHALWVELRLLIPCRTPPARPPSSLHPKTCATTYSQHSRTPPVQDGLTVRRRGTPGLCALLRHQGRPPQIKLPQPLPWAPAHKAASILRFPLRLRMTLAACKSWVEDDTCGCG